MTDTRMQAPARFNGSLVAISADGRVLRRIDSSADVPDGFEVLTSNRFDCWVQKLYRCHREWALDEARHIAELVVQKACGR